MHTMFINNNHASFHFWWKENLVKHQKVSKYYENDCRLIRICKTQWWCSFFFCFGLEIPFLGKFGPKKQNCQFYPIQDATHPLSSADISIFHRKLANFAISRNTDIDFILIHNFLFFQIFLSLLRFFW